MTKKLTFEERLSRLERLMKSRTQKNEFLGLFDKPKRKEEKGWLDKLFKKYPSLEDELEPVNDFFKEDRIFHLQLKTRDKEKRNRITFLITTKGGRGDMYCTAFDSNDSKIDILPKFHLDKDLNLCAKFILQTLQRIKLQRMSESKTRCKNEGVPLTSFDCELIKQMLEDYFDDLPEIEVDVTDDNSDYGFINVGIYNGIYNPEYITSYDIIVNGTRSVEVDHEDKKIGTARSIEDATDILADHFMEDYMNGKYSK